MVLDMLSHMFSATCGSPSSSVLSPASPVLTRDCAP